MSNAVKSARGELVDFDLIRIKQQIASAPPTTVAPRESFIDSKFRRRLKQQPVTGVDQQPQQSEE